MVKKSEINKKGRLAKSTLSVVLAASMVLTSSSFVWAAPADIAIVEEGGAVVEAVEAPVEMAADVVEDTVAESEENAGVDELQTYEFKDSSFEVTGNPFTFATNVATTQNAIWAALSNISFERKINGTLDATATCGFTNLVDATSYYAVTVTNTTTKETTALTEQADIPAAPGVYTVTIKGTENVVGNIAGKGTITGTYTVKDNAEVNLALSVGDTPFDSYAPTYTGNPIEPELTIKLDDITLTKGQDYKIVNYDKNTDVCNKSDDNAPRVIIQYMNDYVARGTKEYTFTIAPAKTGTLTASITNKKVTYNGTVQQPDVKVVYTPVGSSTPVTLTKDTDYTLTIKDALDTTVEEPKAVGKYSIEITAINNFDTVAVSPNKIDYEITKQDFTEKTITVEVPDVEYAGSTAPVVAPILKDTASGIVLDTNDYTVLYEKNGTYVTNPVATEVGKGYIVKLVSKNNNYKSGDLYATYQIVNKATGLQDYLKLNKPVLSGAKNGNEYTYDKDGVVPVKVSINGANYYPNKDADGNSGEYFNKFDLEFPKKEDCKGVGTYEIKVVGKGDWVNQSAVIPYKVVAKEMKNAVNGTVNLYKTNSGSLTTDYKITDESGDNPYTLKNGTDYSYEILKNGTGVTATYKVRFTFKGNYSGTKTLTADLSTEVMPLDSDAITAEVAGEYVYDGAPKEPALKDIILKEDGVALRPGIDYVFVDPKNSVDIKKGYSAIYENNINKGTAKVNIKAKNEAAFKGYRTVEFEIKTSETVKENYVLDTAALKAVYELGSAFDPGKDIKVKTVSGRHLTAGVDYEVKYIRNSKEVVAAEAYGVAAKSGVVTMEITVDATKVKFTASYRIATSLDKVTVIPVSFTDEAYTGSAIEPVIDLKKNNTNISLTKGTDYTVKYENNVNVGTGYITIEGIGEYYGTYLKTFKITATDISKATVSVNGTYKYTGEAIVPDVTVKVGNTVIAPSDYEVKATENTNAGTAKFTVVGKNNCTGTTEESTFTIAKADQKLAVSKAITDALKIRNTNANTYTLKVTGADTKLSYKSSNTKIAAVSSTGKLSFKHICGKATITVTAAADDNHNAATLKVAVAVKPATPKITVTARAKGFNAKATTIKDITGYQVGYSTDKNFAASKTNKKLVKTTKALNKNFSGLSAKKGYYVRVRAYKKVGSTVYWGNWTSAKKITTK